MSEEKRACGVLHTWPVRKIFQCGECPMWEYIEEKSRKYDRPIGFCLIRNIFTLADEYGVDVWKRIEEMRSK